jgi:type VI secretion system protein
MNIGLNINIRKKIRGYLSLFAVIGLVSCTNDVLPELSVGPVSIYTEPDANQNSATAVDLVIIYNQDLVKTLGQMSAAKYFASSKQLLLDNPTLLEIWHWELVPGQIVENFTPPQSNGYAYGAYVFFNYLTPGDHRVKVAPHGAVTIVLMRDDLKNVGMYTSCNVTMGTDAMMGTTMTDMSNEQDVDTSSDICNVRLGPVKNFMNPCRRIPPRPPEGYEMTRSCKPRTNSSLRKPKRIITQPLCPLPKFGANPCRK